MKKIIPEIAHKALTAFLQEVAENTPLGSHYLAFHQRHMQLMLEMPASVGKHHNFPGGYAVHIYEVVRNIRVHLQHTVFPEGKKPTLVDATLAAYLHDLDKLFWRYELDKEKPTEAQLGYARSLGIPFWAHETKSTISKKIDAIKNGRPLPPTNELPVHTYRKDTLVMDDAAAVACLVSEHTLPGVNAEIMHAISLHHGGWAPLARAGGKDLTLRPLAVILHAADMESSQIQNGEE